MNSFQFESPTLFPDVSSTFKIASHHFHKDHNAPCFAPKIFQNYCSQFLLGITVVPFKMLEGKQGALWSMWKWWMTEESSLSSHRKRYHGSKISGWQQTENATVWNFCLLCLVLKPSNYNLRRETCFKPKINTMRFKNYFNLLIV